jgi:nicotinamidase/pyrazinamidase
MKALLIVDIQNDFLPGGALAVDKGDEIIPVVNKLQESSYFDLVVSTQDWHPSDHGSFASNNPGKKPFEITTLSGIEQILWPDHCIQGTEGAEFSKFFDMRKVEAIFRKGMDKNIDSYSGFFDNAKLKDTGLAAYLKGRNINEIYLAGLAGDFCVFFTSMDGIDIGFKTTVIEDATRSINDDGFKEKIKLLMEKSGKVIKSGSILNKE